MNNRSQALRYYNTASEVELLSQLPPPYNNDEHRDLVRRTRESRYKYMTERHGRTMGEMEKLYNQMLNDLRNHGRNMPIDHVRRINKLMYMLRKRISDEEDAYSKTARTSPSEGTAGSNVRSGGRSKTRKNRLSKSKTYRRRR